MDYYETLGVDRTATAAEIKKAYRSKVKQLHPDINADTENAEDAIKAVNEAYDTLKEPDKKAAYDNPQPQGFGGYNPFGHRGPARPPQSQNITGNVGVPIDVLINGGSMNVPIQVPQVQNTRMGFMGFMMSTEIVKIDVPPNTPVGGQIIIPKEDHGFDGIDNLILRIYPENAEDSGYQINGADIYMHIEVDAFDSLFGNKVDVDLPTGSKVKVALPNGIGSGQTIRLPNKGLPQRYGSNGDAYLVVSLIVPELTPDQTDAIKTIVDA